MSAIRKVEIHDRVAAELATVIGALLEARVSVERADQAPDGGWIVAFQANDGAAGTLFVQFQRDDAEALSKRVMGLETEPPVGAVTDTLKELCGQAAGAIVQQPPLAGTTLSVASAVSAASAEAPIEPTYVALTTDGTPVLRLAVWGSVEMRPRASDTNDSASPKLDVILDIDLPLMVRFGRTEMELRALATLGPGSVIDLGRSPDDPVEVVVSNQIVARGEVVIVGGNYGVRITEVISPAERARSVEVRFP